MQVTQQQATLGILGIHILGAVLFCVSSALDGNSLILTIASAIDVLVTTALFVGALRGWRGARYLEIVITTVLIALLIPDPATTPQMDTAILIAPVLALILGDASWVIGSVLVSLGILLLRTGGQGAYADPGGLIIYGICVGGMLLARMVLATAQRQAEANARDAEQRAEEERQRNHELAILNRLSAQLHACQTIAEANQVLFACVHALLPQSSGALYLPDEGQQGLAISEHWGQMPPAGPPALVAECPALQSDTPPTDAFCCILERAGLAYTPLCVPLFAQQELQGLLLIWDDLTALTIVQRQLATTVASQYALALANIVLHKQLRQQAIRDALTGLFNRRYLDESFSRELHLATRTQRPLGLVLLDIDHFKMINDTYGHGVGDQLLQAISTMLQRTTRASDIVYRYGGEEFLLLLPDTGLPSIRQHSERVAASTRQIELLHNGQPLPRITFSIGIAVYPNHGSTLDELLQAADTALYQAKALGRNRICMASAPI